MTPPPTGQDSSSPTAEPSQSRTLPCDPTPVTVARRPVAAALGLCQLPEDLVDRAELVVSEPATNALLHARSRGASTRVCPMRGENVQVAVTDPDPRPVAPAQVHSAPGGADLRAQQPPAPQPHRPDQRWRFS
ncbi:ATP-binding protein [Streptomyces sp. G2]|uniref:ATP-binding protein n=1 Tax=Streptomyces sp. G2 TaxID=1684471 RepID=UPI0035A9727F